MGNKFWFASVVFDGAMHENVQITAESGVIAEIKIGVEQPKDSISFNEMGLPGFIDTHCHGGGGFFFSDREVRNIESIANFHLMNGTTTLFASLVLSLIHI